MVPMNAIVKKQTAPGMGSARNVWNTTATAPDTRNRTACRITEKLPSLEIQRFYYFCM
ncbi:hypothetical protein [Clostridium sp. HBUAS56010]|uniref:hypothetical protein n=1 Tax=Clostridium sp. HBUAS56010 TaxID=2571127 RepID=UPI00163D92E3|nr:hypothetical protein [Clostridium sp. HBUAS56010]